MADDLRTTALRLIHHDRDGSQTELGRGTIDERGRIQVTEARAGNEAYLAEVVADLNALADIAVDVPPEDGAPAFAVATRNVPRDDIDFLAHLPGHARRFYRLELAFDATQIQSPAIVELLEVASDVAEPDDGLGLDLGVPAAREQGTSDPAGDEDEDEDDPELAELLAEQSDEENAPLEDDSEDIAAWGDVKQREPIEGL